MIYITDYSEAKASVPGQQISWVSEWVGDWVGNFSLWASLAVEATKETKFGTKVA